jgi:hypothetical protein
VGGFSASNYMFNMINAALHSASLKVLRPENHVLVSLQRIFLTSFTTVFDRNKAVSNGSISFYLDHFVRSRISKITYGVLSEVIYNPQNADHVKRSSICYTSDSGYRRIPAGFDAILPKVLNLTISFALLGQGYRMSFYRIHRLTRRKSFAAHTSMKRIRRKT